MLRRQSIPALLAETEAYIADFLGIRKFDTKPWAAESGLPYFLRDTFDYWQMTLLGNTVVLAIERGAERRPIGEICRRLDNVVGPGKIPPIYVTDAIDPYERKRLIESKTPFIVPGNQLYLPQMGMALREHFRRRSVSPPAAFTPSAQAMFITTLLRRDWKAEWRPMDVAARLGYTAMTVSRAVREIVAAGAVNIRKAPGLAQYIKLNQPPEEAWVRFGSLLRSPVQRTTWISETALADRRKRLAGLSALARQTMLAEPAGLVVAIKRAHWSTVNASQESPEPTDGYLECQLWNYSPELVPDGDTVDPISLSLSMKGHSDERVEIALEELKGQFSN